MTLDEERTRGLTLTRPWPWAFLHAGKRVENRTWAPPSFMIGGWVALHAGLGFDHDALKRFVNGDFGGNARRVPTDPKAHPAGVVFALARVGTYYGARQQPLFRDDVCTTRDQWAFGPNVWVLESFRPLREPVPCRGFQKLWKLPSDVLSRVLEQGELA